MSGINGGGFRPTSHSSTFNFSLVCFLYVLFIPACVIGSSWPADRRELLLGKTQIGPFFDDIGNKDIEAIEGQTIIIPCTVRKLSYEKVVSWIRSKDIHILTSGSQTFSSDFRFEVVHSEGQMDFWGLRIRGVKVEDTGQYECQVNTEPKLSLAFKITVSSLGTRDDDSKWMGYARIVEPEQVFIQYGSRFHINCEISLLFSRNVNFEVWWLHEDTQITLQTKESRVSIQTTYSKEKNSLHSILSFAYVTWQDAGLYTCLQPSVKKDSLKLVVVEAESSEAMQGDFPQNGSSSAAVYSIFSTILLTNLCFLRVY